MGSGNTTQTSSSSTAPSNPNVTKTTNSLLGGIDSAWATGPSTFNESLYGGQGATTKNGIAALIASANSPDYTRGIDGAMSSFADIASGKNIGVNAPGYQTVRGKLSNDVLTSTNGAFNNSGLFGSDTNQGAAAAGLTDSLGALDLSEYHNGQDRQVQAAGLLPQLLSARQQPASTLLTAGGIQDADTQAALQGRYDLSQRQGNAKTDLLAKLSSILAGNAQAGGSTTTQTTPTTPWWQGLLGTAAQFA